MKKVLIIPDVHGESHWKRHVQESVDSIVFLGDIFDSFTVPRDAQLKNAEEIIEFKISNPHVHICYGNHDLHYLSDTPFRGSGWTADFNTVASLFMESNRQHFKPLHQDGNTLFSHAGINNNWWYFHKYTIEKVVHDFSPNNIEELINIIFNTHHRDILFNIGAMRGGSSVVGGLFWADAREWNTKTLLPNFHQYVGHTPIKAVKTISTKSASVNFCDTWYYDFGNTIKIVEIE